MTVPRSAMVRPVATMRAASMRPVSTPSPVVPWSSRMTWPDCSPPSEWPDLRISSST